MEYMDKQAEIRRERDAAQSTIHELTEAHRRLIEIEEATAAQTHDGEHVAHHQPLVADDDDGHHLAVTGGAAVSSDSARSAAMAASGDHGRPGRLCPSDDAHHFVDDDDEPEEEEEGDAAAQLGYQENDDDDDDEDVWSGPLHEAIATGRLYVPRSHTADHGGHMLSDPALLYHDADAGGGFHFHDASGGDGEATPARYSDGGGEATPARYSDGGGFGGVPASAAAIAGLKKQRYGDGSGADDVGDTCVICMREYRKGKRLYVMPCEHRHRFHRKCLRKWLSRSHLCPLCRHALPTED